MTSWSMDPRKLPNGTVLFFGISYERTQVADTSGRTEPKVYSYAALKQAGVWYFSGAGKVPQAAGWGAVENWLERDNRKLEWVKIVSGLVDVYPVELPTSPVVELATSEEPKWSDDRTYGTGPSPVAELEELDPRDVPPGY